MSTTRAPSLGVTFTSASTRFARPAASWGIEPMCAHMLTEPTAPPGAWPTQWKSMSASSSAHSAALLIRLLMRFASHGTRTPSSFDRDSNGEPTAKTASARMRTPTTTVIALAPLQGFQVDPLHLKARLPPHPLCNDVDSGQSPSTMVPSHLSALCHLHFPTQYCHRCTWYGVPFASLHHIVGACPPKPPFILLYPCPLPR